METKVGVKEFRANLPTYLESVEPVTITRHGETIGYYIPAHRGRDQAELDALKVAAGRLDAMLTDLGLSEDEIVADFRARRAAAGK